MINLIGVCLWLASFLQLAQCNSYCDHKWMTTKYYENYNSAPVAPAPNAAHIKPININNRKSPNVLLVTDYSAPNTGKTFLSTAATSGTFHSAQDKEISNSDFCSANGILHVADVDGDHYDDLLCQRHADGSFTVRHHNNADFGEEIPYATGFRCAIGTSELLIDDIDGDNAEDLICVDKLRANAGNMPIYFSRSCHLEASYNYQARYHRHYRHSSVWHGGMPLKHCRGLPGNIQYLPPGALPGCDTSDDLVIMLDSNGDGQSDIACQTDEVAPELFDLVVVFSYLSNGRKESTIFSRNPQKIIQCSRTDRVIVGADIDGDGDDDIICPTNQVNIEAAVAIAFAENGEHGLYGWFSVTPASSCSKHVFCTHGSATTAPTYYVGDFNKDGRDDLMCRFFNGINIETQVVYSEIYP